MVQEDNEMHRIVTDITPTVNITMRVSIKTQAVNCKLKFQIICTRLQNISCLTFSFKCVINTLYGMSIFIALKFH